MDSGYSTFMTRSGDQISGYRLDRAKDELQYWLGRMSDEQRFDLVVTDQVPFACFGELQQATGSVMDGALEFLGNIAGGGEAGLGPAVEWALLNEGYGEAKAYFLISGGPPITVDDTEAYWRETWLTINEANNKGAVFNVMLISPDESSGVIQFAELLVEQTGGSLVILE